MKVLPDQKEMMNHFKLKKNVPRRTVLKPKKHSLDKQRMTCYHHNSTLSAENDSLYKMKFSSSVLMATSACKTIVSRWTPLKGIIFDMDGTLTKPSIDFPKMRRIIGAPEGVDILEFVKHQPTNTKRIMEKQICELEKEARTNLELQEQCLEMLTHIQQKNIPCAIITRNNIEGVNDFLRLCQKETSIPLRFDPILTREDGDQYCKPKPGGLIHICNTWKVQPVDVLMVGDHLHDLRAGNDAGCRSCLLHCDKPDNSLFREHADLVIFSLWELTTLPFDQ